MTGLGVRDAAEAAARESGVTIRQLTTLGEMDGVCALFDELWPPGPAGSMLSTEVLRALTKAGNYLGGAFDGDKLIGACVGFFGAPADRSMHSHVAGVSAAGRGRHVGFALKLDQRAWAVDRGVRTISWTYDPLVRRNAYFNLAKLGAVAAEYLPDFYGGMDDAVNRGAGSDRLLVRWDLAAPAPSPVDLTGATVALGRSDQGDPLPGATEGERLLVATPSDVERLRVTDPERAAAWRAALREALAALMAAGLRVTGFDRSGWYVLERRENNA